MKLSSALKVDPNTIRTRSFTIAGQTLKVRVPLASEMELMNERVNNAEFEAMYQKMAGPLLENKDAVTGETITFDGDDILVDGKSLKNMAKQAAQTNARILEMFKLLVPAVDFDMSQLTYEMIEEEYPFSIQLDISKKIAEVISPGFEEARKN